MFTHSWSNLYNPIYFYYSNTPFNKSSIGFICVLNFLKKGLWESLCCRKGSSCLERLANNSNNYEGILISRRAKHSRMRGCHFGKEKELIQFLLFKPHEKHTTPLFVISLHTQWAFKGISLSRVLLTTYPHLWLFLRFLADCPVCLSFRGLPHSSPSALLHSSW